MVKYNFGSGRKKEKDFISVDSRQEDGVGVVYDLTKVPYPFVQPNTVDEIISIEFLEHISFRDTINVLKEWYKILKVGGILHIQVPAIDKMCEMFANREICSCVSHKPVDEVDAKALDCCEECGGKGKVNPNRWLFAFTGAQKHEFDLHRNIFTKDIMMEDLIEAGFSNIDIGYDNYNWKLTVKCIK
jgi:SAM-dependent methyltransferase